MRRESKVEELWRTVKQPLGLVVTVVAKRVPLRCLAAV